MKTILIIIGVLILIVFIVSFHRNSQSESTGEAAKSGLASAGGCLLFIIFIIFFIAQCAETFNPDSSTNRKIKAIERGEYDPYD